MNYTLKNISKKKVWESENIFYLKSNVSRLSKFIYHYEIYKKIIDLPGDILEFGVFKGASFSKFLAFRKILENDFSRKVIGFDDFGSFTKKGDKEDKKFAVDFFKEFGKGINNKELEKILTSNNYENFQLIKGDIVKTLPTFLKKNKQLKISLLHLDLDIYRPTIFVLKTLFDKVVKDGIILIDDYAEIFGATKAVDLFFKNKQIIIKKLSFYKRPSFIIKK